MTLAEPFTAPATSHVQEWLRMLYKRRWTAITAFIVIVTAGSLYTFSLTPMYEARAQLLIEVDEPNVLSFREVVDQNRATLDYFQTQYRILQSRALARRTVNNLQLWGDPHFAPTPPTGPAKVAEDLKESASRWIDAVTGSSLAAGESAGENVTETRVLNVFQANLTVAPVRSSRLIDVRYRSTDPVFAAKIVDGLAQAYIQQTLDFKYTASKDATEWLSSQLETQRHRVGEDELALQKYREQNDAVSLEDRQNIVVQKLADLNAAVTKAKMDRIQKETTYNQVKLIQNNASALDMVPAVLTNAYIQQQKLELANLQRQYNSLGENLGPKHPELVKINNAIQTAQVRIQAETVKVVESLRNDYIAARAQEEGLTAALEQQKREALELNRKSIDYNALQRNASANKQLFDSLLQRARETGISGELRTSNVRVVDPAEVPQSPSYPNRRNNLLAFGFGGILFGFGLAFLFEYLDSRIKSPEEIQEHLGIHCLGLLPIHAAKNGDDPLFGHNEPLLFMESLRSLRTNLVFSFTEERARAVLVTSTAPSEGKTLTATNVASALASIHQRVLLVDADMRRPRVHEVMNVKREPGLSDLLVGHAKASDVVQKTARNNLWVLPAGKLPPNPAELLGSDRFRQLLPSLKEHFDWIILDSPPVLPVTDASILGHLVEGVLFVIGSEMTSRHVAQQALSQLRSGKSRVVGAVLNRVALEKESYYYGRYYRPKYATYYVPTQK